MMRLPATTPSQPTMNSIIRGTGILAWRESIVSRENEGLDC